MSHQLDQHTLAVSINPWILQSDLLEYLVFPLTAETVEVNTKLFHLLRDVKGEMVFWSYCIFAPGSNE